MDSKMPFEVSMIKAKEEIIMAVNQISQKYDIPTPLLTMIMEQIVSDGKINAYTTIIGICEVSSPKNE